MHLQTQATNIYSKVLILNKIYFSKKIFGFQNHLLLPRKFNIYYGCHSTPIALTFLVTESRKLNINLNETYELRSFADYLQLLPRCYECVESWHLKAIRLLHFHFKGDYLALIVKVVHSFS